MKRYLSLCLFFSVTAFAEIDDVSNNTDRISFYLSAGGEDGSTRLYSLLGKEGRKTDIADWGYTNTVPVEVDLPSASVAASWADGNDTTKRTMRTYTVEQLTILKIHFDIINDIRSRHGQGNLTRTQFENAVLKPAYQWAKEDAQ